MAIQLPNVNQLIKPIAAFLRRFHIIIFFIAVSSGLVVALLIIVAILDLSGSSATTTNTKINRSFDEATLKRIDSLSERSPSQPGNRPSPFVEQ